MKDELKNKEIGVLIRITPGGSTAEDIAAFYLALNELYKQLGGSGNLKFETQPSQEEGPAGVDLVAAYLPNMCRESHQEIRYDHGEADSECPLCRAKYEIMWYADMLKAARKAPASSPRDLEALLLAAEKAEEAFLEASEGSGDSGDDFRRGHLNGVVAGLRQAIAHPPKGETPSEKPSPGAKEGNKQE